MSHPEFFKLKKIGMTHENAFFRWKTILGEKMYARKFNNQKTEAVIKAAVLNQFIQVAAPKAIKVA
ncbi:MAG: hypothetical protein OHK0019_04060 [Saprospiraceae bacterium]